MIHFDWEEDIDRDECPGCFEVVCMCASLDNDDDHGPLDSPDGDSESDHVWADLRRSEAE